MLQEVLQIVYLKVLEGKARYNGASSFKTWLFAVIRKTALDQRRRSLLRTLTALKIADGRAARSEHPDESAYRSEIQVMFRRALALLPRRQREALELVFYHELNIQEAAAVMGVSLGSARTHAAPRGRSPASLRFAHLSAGAARRDGDRQAVRQKMGTDLFSNEGFYPCLSARRK